MAERSQHENGKRAVSDLFVAAIEASPHGIVLERDGTIIYANTQFLHLAGEQLKSLIGLSARDLRKRCKAARLSDAEVEWTNYHSRTRGQSVRIYILREIAAQRRLERQLVESHKMEALGRLVSGVTHDFNNVLTAIALYTDLLAGVSQGEPAARYLSEIRRSADRGSERIRQLLAFARKRPMEPQVVFVNIVLRGMEDTLRQMLGGHIHLAVRYGAHAGNVQVDPAQLEEVILNLAMNGRDAMPEGGTLTIETSVVKSGRGNKRSHLPDTNLIKITIRDDGCGMDTATRSHMFEPFFTTKQPGRGTGLGLATAYGFVSQSGGTISLESEPEGGTTVTILLPRTTARAGVVAATQKPAVRRGSESLLVVEDDPYIRASLQGLLTRCGYRVNCAPDREIAMQLARSGMIDAVIWDEALPGTDVHGLTGQLASVCPKAKVLFLSSSGATSRRKEYVFINKPFDLADLTQKLRQVLDGEAVDSEARGKGLPGPKSGSAARVKRIMRPQSISARAGAKRVPRTSA
jgi:two-component system, cell cycle sensor histidine kinase and response regulator CckA